MAFTPHYHLPSCLQFVHFCMAEQLNKLKTERAQRGRGGIPKDINGMGEWGVQVSQTVRPKKLHLDLSST